MTPLHLQMMLHYWTRNEAYAYREPEHADSGAVHEQRGHLIAIELLAVCPPRVSGYEVTEKGEAYINALLSTPLPIKKWVMPNADARDEP